ncbi:MAG: biotin--[acetyl-CoA-carboxylase] ligase [Halobacteriovoraceae bacterium]|nr:biotin--[acetyl-CoA-carboxylase] ligase [Halobacteriovoraceae bacterium]
MKMTVLSECHSTQDYLKNQLDQGLKTQEVQAVLTLLQSQGKGQRGRSWVHLKNSLALSLALRPNEVLSLSSLEVAVLLCMFFREKYQRHLQLKWPNDLLNLEGKKVGGILTEVYDKNTIVVGIGLNLLQDLSDEWDVPNLGFLFESEDYEGIENLACELANYFENQRLNAEETRTNWLKLCAHLDKNVDIVDGKQSFSGIFKGIGPHGEGLVLHGEEEELRKVFTGSLRFG